MADHSLVWEPSARDTMDSTTKNLHSQNKNLTAHEMKLIEFGLVKKQCENVLPKKKHQMLMI